MLTLLLPALALAKPTPLECPGGQAQLHRKATDCCWEGQAWDQRAKQCTGEPTCPEGTVAGPPEQGCVESNTTTISRVAWPGLDGAIEQSRERLSRFDGFHRVLFQPMHFRPLVEVYIFFETQEVKEMCVGSSCVEEVRLVVLEELSRSNLGAENGRSAEFYLDSHENVVGNYC